MSWIKLTTASRGDPWYVNRNQIAEIFMHTHRGVGVGCSIRLSCDPNGGMTNVSETPEQVLKIMGVSVRGLDKEKGE